MLYQLKVFSYYKQGPKMLIFQDVRQSQRKIKWSRPWENYEMTIWEDTHMKSHTGEKWTCNLSHLGACPVPVRYHCSPNLSNPVSLLPHSLSRCCHAPVISSGQSWSNWTSAISDHLKSFVLHCCGSLLSIQTWISRISYQIITWLCHGWLTKHCNHY